MIKKLYREYISSYRMDTQNWLDYLEAAGEIYSCPQVQGLQQYEQHFKINRLQHIRSVAYLSFVISRKLGLDYVNAARGATMHDLFYYDWRENDWSHRPHGYRHPGFALKNAYELRGSLTKKEADIIKHHMWPLTVIPPRCREGFIVSLCDKYCATIEVYYSFNKKYQKKFHSLTGIAEVDFESD